MSTPTDTTTDLLHRVALHDRRAFTALYRLTSGRIRGVVQRLLVDSAQSEEVVQEVFLEIWQSAPKYARERATAMGWMAMIARRRAIDRVRASQASRVRDAKAGLREWLPPADDFADSLDTRMTHSRAIAALGELTRLQREAIALVYCDQLTHQEAAEALRVTPGVVRSRVRDGLLRLRTHVSPATAA